MTKLILIKPKKPDHVNILGYKRITILETFTMVTGTGKNKELRSYFLAETESGTDIFAWDDLWASIEHYKAVK